MHLTNRQRIALRVLVALLFVLIGLTISHLSASDQSRTVRLHETVRVAP